MNEPPGGLTILTRRAMLLGSTAVVFASLLNGCRSTLSRPSANAAYKLAEPSIYVLVHGAWHGGWCWDLVKDILEKQGHLVYAPTLTGLGQRAAEMNADIGLKVHIDDVMGIIEENNLHNIILVGHSYGGMVITGVADQLKQRIKQIVYLDAALPRDGQSMISYGPPKSETVLKAAVAQLRQLAPDGIAMAVFPPEFLGIPTDHPRYEWVKLQLTPHPLRTWLDPIKLLNDGEAGLERTYIHCTQPVMLQTSFPYIAMQVSSDPEWSYHEIKTGHDAMITAPAELTELLISG